jgi:hypothetical protein
VSSCEKAFKQHLKARGEILRQVSKERSLSAEEDDDEDDDNNSYNKICQPSSSNL